MASHHFSVVNLDNIEIDSEFKIASSHTGIIRTTKYEDFHWEIFKKISNDNFIITNNPLLKKEFNQEDLIIYARQIQEAQGRKIFVNMIGIRDKNLFVLEKFISNKNIFIDTLKSIIQGFLAGLIPLIHIVIGGNFLIGLFKVYDKRSMYGERFDYERYEIAGHVLGYSVAMIYWLPIYYLNLKNALQNPLSNF